MHALPYRGYIIQLMSVPVAAGQWDLIVHIERAQGPDAVTQQWREGHTFPTQRAAILRGFAQGKRQIDAALVRRHAY
jgi:hypothetical protein